MPALTISPEELQKGLDILAAAAVAVTGVPVGLGINRLTILKQKTKHSSKGTGPLATMN